MRRAEALWLTIQEGYPPTFESTEGLDLADEIHALLRLIAREDRPFEAESPTFLYEAVDRLSWPDDDFDEKTELLTRISYLAWLSARRGQSHPELPFWEERAVRHASGQESVQAFFAIPAVARSGDLNQRFLRDPAVLLAACVRLRGKIEVSPAVVRNEAVLTREWLCENRQLFGSREESAYFVAELTWIVAATSKHCGRYRDCHMWLDRLEECCDDVAGADGLRARTGYSRLAVLYEQRSYSEVLQGLPRLKETLGRLGMHLYLAKSCFLEAVTLKEIGRDEKAWSVYDALVCDPVVRGDPCLYGLVLVGLAELDGRRGQFDLAMARLSGASAVLQEAGAPFAVGQLHAVKGELFRDKGLLLFAVGSYREALRVYAIAGMASLAAYIRVVLAETLLAAGREDEATLEIVAALPTIDESGLVHEAMAAIVLLRESIRRQKLDPSALRELREQLERMKNRGEM